MIEIALERMSFYAYHGVLEQEKKVGNHFELSLILGVEAERALTSDKLEDTLNYAEVYALVAEEMQTPSKLLEHVVWGIARRLFDTFPLIRYLDLRLRKLKAPISGDLGAVSVRLKLTRDEATRLLVDQYS